ncbi:unnamed protein product [Rotaria magnacalcarata]|uniref:Uncharacterized protein n=1 Tax=Rotaria magnacalcarata TaxID=392030 RepID=A0A819F130_9BILA|nr:unnamed protein product [Rotaria magnacalcarata]
MAATEVLGRSFSDALYERYCDFDSTFDDLKNDCDIVFFVGSSPKKTESGLILNASTVVLTDERISHVGDPHAVTISCFHVELVDISSNAFSDWHEISLLLSSLPHVKTINLSFNPFPSDLHILPVELQWPNLNTLCLNGSHIGMEMIVELLKKTPNLEELQICSNDYTEISSDYGFQHGNLKRLYISNNNLTDWSSICYLGRLFTRLETFIASDNPLKSFRSDDDVTICLPYLHTLSVDKVQVSEWDDIIALTKLPRLIALRIHMAPLLKPYQKDERFFLLLGYMKHLTKLNGSVITANERETSERRFIRFYSQQDDKPQRYFELTEKHGNLKPLVDIKIRAPYLINVRLVHNQITHDKEIDVRQTVQQFKKYLHEMFHIPLTRIRIFYIDDVAFNMGICGPEELKYPQRLLHTYNMHDGDQFHIDIKQDPPKPQYSSRLADTSRNRNGPSAIVLSYILSGHTPYWNGCPVSNDYLNIKLEQYVKDNSLLEQDLEFLSDGLEGRSRNPVSLLIDNLIHPDADLGAHLQSKIKWRHDPSLSIDHICIGRGGIGGVWHQLTSKHLQTVSMAHWMELPNYPITTFRQHRRIHRTRSSTENKQATVTNDQNSIRATYEEVHSYYIHYVKRNRLTNCFRNGCEVTSVQRVCSDAPYYDDLIKEIRTPETLWEIRGFEEQTKVPFIMHAKYVVLATGISHHITRPLGIIGEQASQSFTYTSLLNIEEIIINKKCLTKHSKPLLVIGCGLAAIDVILLCQQYSVPVLHVFRRSVDDHELVTNQLVANIYPEFERIKELMKQSSTTTVMLSEWFYQCCSQSEVISITQDGTAHIRNHRTQTIRDYNISFVVRLTGNEMKVPFLPSVAKKNTHGMHLNPYTYECIDFENIYALGALAGDKLVRFLHGGAIACAASLLKKYSQALCIHRQASV